MRWINLKLFIISSLFVIPAIGFAESLTYARWSIFANLYNPARAEKKLILFNDLTGDGKAEVVMRYKDLHNGQDAEFRIYSLKISGKTAETDSLLLKIKTSDDYCKRIQIRDVDGDGVREILLQTVSKDLKRIQIYVIRFSKKYKSFTLLKPDKPFGSHVAEYRFTRLTKHTPAELKVIAPILPTKSIFTKINKLHGQLPHFWHKQIYYVKSDKLERFDSGIIYTPFYVLDRFLRALSEQKYFSAYRHFFSKLPYFKFKKMIKASYSFLANKKVNGQYYLRAWQTEKYRKIRHFGWLTFSFFCNKEGQKYRILYQVFMKKVFDEWKIIKMRRVRTIKG